MAKRRNSPALFELLRNQSASTHPGSAPKVAAPPAAVGVGLRPAAAVAPPPTVEPKPVPVPTREAEPLDDKPDLDLSTPRYVAEPVRVAPGSPEMPDLAGLEPEPLVSRGDDGRVSFSLSVGTIAGIVGGVVVVLVLFGASLYSLGGRASKEELKPIISDEANRALGDSDASQPRDLRVREPVRVTPREPVREAEVAISPEPTVTPPITPPVVADVETPSEDGRALAQDPAAEATGPSNFDTRQPGLNYMYTSMTFDRDEAVRAQQFLFDNGIDSIIEEMTRASDGQKAYRLWTLVGIPGQGFSTSREKFNHQSAMFDLGNRWLTEQGGTLDFSRESQIGWIKFGG